MSTEAASSGQPPRWPIRNAAGEIVAFFEICGDSPDDVLVVLARPGRQPRILVALHDPDPAAWLCDAEGKPQVWVGFNEEHHPTAIVVPREAQIPFYEKQKWHHP